jgi:hypothetical protein
VKRLVLKAVPDEVTRVAMPKRGEVDIAYAVRGAIAEDILRTPGLSVKPVHNTGMWRGEVMGSPGIGSTSRGAFCN